MDLRNAIDQQGSPVRNRRCPATVWRHIARQSPIPDAVLRILLLYGLVSMVDAGSPAGAKVNGA